MVSFIARPFIKFVREKGLVKQAEKFLDETVQAIGILDVVHDPKQEPDNNNNAPVVDTNFVAIPNDAVYFLEWTAGHNQHGDITGIRAKIHLRNSCLKVHNEETTEIWSSSCTDSSSVTLNTRAVYETNRKIARNNQTMNRELQRYLGKHCQTMPQQQ